jgi:hypothetical protein
METTMVNCCNYDWPMRELPYARAMVARTTTRLELVIGILACACSLGWSAPAKSTPAAWGFPELRFRTSIIVHSGLYPRQNCLVRWPVEPGALLRPTGIAGSLATNSFRVVPVDSPTEIAHLFVPGAGQASELRWLLPGELDLLSGREFWVYFDTQNSPGAAAASKPAGPAPDLAALLPDEPANLARNPGFEIADSHEPTTPVEWLAYALGDSKGRAALVENPRHSGQRSLKLEGVSGQQFGVRQDQIPLKPNTLYRLGVWGRADASNTNELMCVQLLAVLRNAAGQSVALQRASIDTAQAVLPDAWKHLQKRGLMSYHSRIRTPPDTASCNLRIYLWNDPTRELSMSGTVYIDDVELVEVRPQDLVPAVSVEVGKVEQRSQAGS